MRYQSLNLVFVRSANKVFGQFGRFGHPPVLQVIDFSEDVQSVLYVYEIINIIYVMGTPFAPITVVIRVYPLPLSIRDHSLWRNQ